MHSLTTEALEVQPDPVRMINGLRDTGYQFNTAVADIVDNSIAADATRIVISLTSDYRGNIRLAIFDDGVGMDREGLINAMRYGSPPRPSARSLGKFGLGLKTASTAYCRRLVVISRSAESDLNRAIWDLDHIASTAENGTSARWELLLDRPDPKQVEEFEKYIGTGSGTLVVWEKVDRLLRNYQNPAGAPARKALDEVRKGLFGHLSCVYQRFLDVNDQRASNITILLNDEPVPPWDPFCKGLSQLVNEEEQEVQLSDGTTAPFTVKAYVLPRREEFPDEAAAKAARLGSHDQGIYVYRENRLIHGPDWLKIFAKEPHFTLLRVEFSFDYRLDEAFQIDIKKSQIILAEGLYDHLKVFLTPPRRVAEDVYRKGTRNKSAVAGETAHDSSNRSIASKERSIKTPILKSSDPATGEATITNNSGTVTLKLKISSADRPSEFFVKPVESIDDGLLWEPALIDGHYAVRINTGHPYYHKVYMPNLNEGVTIQGIDSLLWGLCIAELSCVTDETKRLLEEMRYEVSRNLKKLVQDLPDAEVAE